MTMTTTASAPRIVMGVDVGDSFTDVVALDPATGGTTVVKLPTNREDRVENVVAAIRECVPDLSSIGTIVIATRVGTDAILEGRLARTGIITTAGFADILEVPRPEHVLEGRVAPVVPRVLRRETPERTLAYGAVDRKVDTLAVLEAAQDFIAERCESVAVMFLNAPANSYNERAAVRALQAIWPNPHVTSAVDLTPEIAEYERFSTAALNAGLQPIMTGFLVALERTLESHGARPELLVMQSNGGAATLETAKHYPVRTVGAGAAAGALGAARIAGTTGLTEVIACDIGGASCEVALIVGGESVATRETAIGAGQVIRQPMTAVSSIGSGGCTAAWVDGSGRPRVGPDATLPASRGGGDRPTVTDANLVLGRIDPERLSSFPLDKEAAEQAIAAHIAEPLGLDIAQAAEAVVKLANSGMSAAIRRVAIGQGHDPEGFAVLFHGEIAGLHAGGVFRDLGVSSALIPLHPGATSAFGCTLADLRNEVAKTLDIPFEAVDPDRLTEELAAAAAQGEAALERSGIAFERIDRLCSLDIAQAGRTRSLRLVDGIVTREALAATITPGIPARIAGRRVAVIGRRGINPGATTGSTERSLETARTGVRKIFAEGVWHEAPVYDRFALPVGVEITGIAIIEQPDATIYIDPGLVVSVDASENLVLA